MNIRLWLVVSIAVLGLIACRDSQRPDETSASVTPHRTNFAPDEFGIGRPHTKNPACNREIDKFLEQIRICYNGGSDTDCAALQRTHSAQIGKLKNSHRCRQ